MVKRSTKSSHYPAPFGKLGKSGVFRNVGRCSAVRPGGRVRRNMSVPAIGRTGDEINGYTTGTFLGLGTFAAVDPAIVAAGTQDSTPSPIILDGETALWIGNSYTSNYDEAPLQVAYLVDQMAGVNVTMGPTPYLATTIGNPTGYYSGMTMAQMVRNGAAGLPAQPPTSTDAVDALASLGSPPEHVVLTSGFQQEFAHPSTDDLDWTREALADLAPVSGDVIIRMTHEGRNPDHSSSSVSDYTDDVEYIVQQARIIEAENHTNLLRIVPEAYVWWWLQVGDPVPSYTTLTHPESNSAGNRRYGWLCRTQWNGSAYVMNGHQGWSGTMISAWTWAYAAFGLSPVGDDTYDDALPSGAGANFMTTTQLYLGPQASSLHFNNGGPSDVPSVVPWNAAIRDEITPRIVAAVDAYYAGTTPFD